MLDSVLTLSHLSQVMVHATAPAFMLGALASFISLIIGRMNGVVERSRMIGQIKDDDVERQVLKSDLPRLKNRSRLLQRSIHFAVASSIATIVLIVLAFVFAFLGVRHEVGGGFIFVVALILFGISLGYLAKEVSIGLSDLDHRA